MNTSQCRNSRGKTKLHLENNWIALEHKSKSDAMVLLNQELAGLEASLKISEQVVLKNNWLDTQKNNNRVA
jgi:exonuclease SbcC